MDGLIQKVFKDNIYLFDVEVNDVTVHVMSLDAIQDLKKELIRIIYKHRFDSDAYFNDKIKEMLIGDNYE